MNMARCEIYSKRGISAACQHGGGGGEETFMNLKGLGKIKNKRSFEGIYFCLCTNTPDTGKGHGGSTHTHMHPTHRGMLTLV